MATLLTVLSFPSYLFYGPQSLRLSLTSLSQTIFCASPSRRPNAMLGIEREKISRAGIRYQECCESGSGIQNHAPVLPLDPGSGIGKYITDPQQWVLVCKKISDKAQDIGLSCSSINLNLRQKTHLNSILSRNRAESFITVIQQEK